jgi:hypothetical protein
MRALAFVLAFALAPGAAEAVEDLAHYLSEGHMLHAPTVENAAHADHDEHEQGHDDDEHGCSTLFHVCACHSPAPSMVTMWLTFERTRETQDDLLRVLAGESRRAIDGVSSESFRPPIA